MSIFSDSLLFSAMMTLPDALRQLKQDLYLMQEAAVREALHGHENDRQTVISTCIQEIRKNKLDAVMYMDRIITAADKASGGGSDLQATQIIDLLFEPTVFESIQKQIPSKDRRVQQLDKAVDYANIRCIAAEIGAQDIFDNIEDYLETYENGFSQISAMLIQGSVTGECTNALNSFAESMARSLVALEYLLNYEDPSTGWPGNRLPSDFLDRFLAQLVKKQDEMWQNMSQEDQKEADFERWQREHPADGYEPAQAEDPSDQPKSTYKETAQAETIQEKDWSSLAMETFDNPREAEKTKLRTCFDGKIVRKDLTKKIKEGANVPVYVLEFLLGQYCSSDDEEIIAKGVENVKRILADNFVRPDEAQKILSVLRARGAYTVIDKITVGLNIKKDVYEAEFSNLGLKNIPISEEYPEKFDRLLCGGIWCIVQLEYEFVEEDKQGIPIRIRKLTPIQMPHVDINELKEGRKAFTKEEWIDVMLRSIGMEPDMLSTREKWLLLLRMVPLVENNFNLCELGPRSTGKSHLYKEISPNSILVSGGQTTVANLFYNMARKTVGLVGLWDCVAFDEVAGINFKDKDGIQIMKDYMASGSFARGKEEKAASASMVFVGNINQSVDVLLKTSSLFDPFPPEMGTDTAFLDRIHCYLPGWEIPKFRPEHFTNDYGFITDYLAEFLRELRKEQYGDALDRYFRLGKNLNQRDTIGVRKMVGGLLKLVYPDGCFGKEELEEILKIALEMRRRVKEQLKKLGGMEFYDVNFSYIDNESFEEHFVSVPEQGGGKLIPEGLCNPGQVYTIGHGKSGMIGVFRLESQSF